MSIEKQKAGPRLREKRAMNSTTRTSNSLGWDTENGIYLKGIGKQQEKNSVRGSANFSV